MKALRDAPPDFGGFRAAAGVRTPAELVCHMTSVLGYARTFFIGGQYRRLAGGPVAPENFIVAEIHADRCGSQQAEPVSPDGSWPEAPDGWTPPSRR